VSLETNPVEEVITDKPHAILLIVERSLAELTVRRIVGILQPSKVGLHHALGMRRHHAVLTHIYSVLKAELVCHFALWALAQPHPKLSLKKCYQAV